MDNEQNDKPDLLDNLLPLSPEVVLSGFQMEMRKLLDPIRLGLQTIADEELSKEERDDFIKLMQKNAEDMSEAIQLTLRYLKARYEPK